MQYITRTFQYTKATVSRAEIVNGNPTFTAVKTLTLVGDVSKDKALKIAKKDFDGDTSNLIITELASVEELRGMTVEAFIHQSEIMDNPRTPHIDEPTTDATVNAPEILAEEAEHRAQASK